MFQRSIRSALLRMSIRLCGSSIFLLSTVKSSFAISRFRVFLRDLRIIFRWLVVLLMVVDFNG